MVSVLCLVHFDVLVVGHTNEGSFDLCVHLIIWEEVEHQKEVLDAKDPKTGHIAPNYSAQ